MSRWPAVVAIPSGARVEALGWSLAARLLLATLRLERSVSVLDRLVAKRMADEPAALPPAEDFARAGACLGQSLARSQFLRRRGLPHAIVIGVVGPANRFAAHAWVEPYEQCPDGFHELRRIER